MLRNEKQFKTEVNCYRNLILREYSARFNRRYSLHALKSLCLQANYKYKKVWEKTSSKNITTEHGRIYFDNYTNVYGGYGRGNKPKHLYSLTSHRTENALTCTARTEEIGLIHNGDKDCLICVTKDNKELIRVHLTSGKILQQIYLSPVYKFRDISWNESQSSIVVRSTKSHGSHRQQTDIVKVLAVFDVKPLQFVGMMEIKKQEFGANTVDAGLCQGVLITMHQQSVVKMYSFQHILDMYRTSTYKLDDVIGDEGHRLGHRPIGLKFNIKIEESPPVLFTVSCYDHIVEFSNKPFHYLYSPVKTPEYFEVHSLENRSLIENGILKTGILDYANDRYRATFWDDDSGRVLHIATSVVSFYNLTTVPIQDNGERILQKSFEMNLSKEKSKKDIPYTSSGRRVSKPKRQDSVNTDQNMTIYNVDYEDELDIISVTAVYHDTDEPRGVVCFYDNKTGTFLKEIDIEEPCSEIHEHRTLIDLDTIVQINKLWSGNFHCNMYRLTNVESNKQEVKNKPGRKISRTYHRTRNR
ncbi:DCAF17 [Mytilus coruscus]|uniref:DCAF17 n=1 Tax=Mytilus coruscus TaxID=42192 RepID=A0A6J8EXQ4_MYTCO|nr:DCAF17 [Mytilus coruscus]